MVPTLARIRLIEDEARHQRITVRVAKRRNVVVLRSRTISETLGFMKTLVRRAATTYEVRALMRQFVDVHWDNRW